MMSKKKIGALSALLLAISLTAPLIAGCGGAGDAAAGDNGVSGAETAEA